MPRCARAHLDQCGRPVDARRRALGCGKSWTLYRLGHVLDARGEPVVLIRAGTSADLCTQLRLAIAGKALLLEQPIESAALGQLWRRVQATPDAVVTILWEGCRDARVLDEIRLQGGLGPGLNLVAELPVTNSLTLTEFERCPVHQVGEFTPLQLFEALDKRGVSAGLVPQSIRRMLRLPVLCGIYATLALEREDWNPQTEYRVLEDFWARARSRAGSFAGTRLKALARLLLQVRRTAANDDEIASLGFTEAELEALSARPDRLVRAGPCLRYSAA